VVTMAATRSSAPIRVGLLGAGRIGRLHAGLLAREIPGAELAAVADAAPAVAEALAGSLGVPALSLEEMLASPDVDAVAVCSSTDTHVDLVIRAAEAGKAVFCEKPVSLDLVRVDDALVAVEKAGVSFMVGFNRRFDPGHRAVYESVRAGSIGELHLVRISSRDPEPPPPEYLVHRHPSPPTTTVIIMAIRISKPNLISTLMLRIKRPSFSNIDSAILYIVRN